MYIFQLSRMAINKNNLKHKAMFLHIFTFELQYRIRKISTYIYFLLFAAIGFMAIWRGSHGGGILTNIVMAGIGEINTNAPYALFYLITVITNYSLFVIAGYFGAAAIHEYKHNTQSLYFSYPISKFNYLSGRFAASFVISLFIVLGITFGAILASLSPFVLVEKMAPINLFVYLQPYLVSVIPNILIIGAISFSISLLTRKFFQVYTAVVAFVILYLIGSNLYVSMNSSFLPSMIDPFGHIAANSTTDYWTIAQKNSFFVPLDGSFILNRLLWLSIAILILFIAYIKFNPSNIVFSQKEKSMPLVDNKTNALPNRHINTTEGSIVSFSFKSQLKLLLSILFYEFKGLAYNRYFLAILAMGFSLLFILGFRNIGLAFDTQTLPVTSQVLETTKDSLYLLNLLIVLFC